jgi:putative transposase
MLVQKAYKFKLKTNTREKVFFSKVAGCIRLVWNKSLALQKANCEYINQQFVRLGGLSMNESKAKKLKKQLYREYFPTGFDIITKALVPIWKKSEELNFLNECPAQSLQKPLGDLDKAFFKAFTKKGGFPKFKKKGLRDSIYFPQGFKIKNNKVFLPKIGWVKFFKTRNIEGTIKNITVTSDGFGNWFASFCTEQERNIEKRTIGEIGIDLGVTNFSALSNGELIKKPASIKNLLAIKKRVARAVSRKKLGGKNRARAVLVLRKVETKIANIRKDFHAKTSTLLSKNHALIVVEDLKILNMSKSAKGTKENPGVNVKAKSGLNREILANGWGDFRTMLKYKQEYSGGVFLTVSPINTSRTCSCCGSIDKNSRVRQEWYACLYCGYEIHADTNAAINILVAGRVALGDINNISCLAQES